jgi:hypothetical protein
MNIVKRDKWTEADIDALPPGEHDYFDRKSGQLFGNPDKLLGALAKACSAFANSGGGHLVLGVDDARIPDGVPTTIEGRTSTRDWLEQKVPHLVEYALADFRVHVVIPSAPSRIPPDKHIIVIDIGDSALAPHQCNYGGGDARKYVYYYRQAGRSEPAPHFYLELLRQRLTNAVLAVTLESIIPDKIKRTDVSIFLAMRFHFSIENVGRVAAYKWQVQIREWEGEIAGREQDYVFGIKNFPQGMTFAGSYRIDDTILPGGFSDQDIRFGIFMRPSSESRVDIESEIDRVLPPVRMGFRIATETSSGDIQHVELRSVVHVRELAEFVVTQLQSA